MRCYFCGGSRVSRMPNTNYSVITNFGCHYQCPYCITKQTGMALPETDALAVSKTLRNLLRTPQKEAVSMLADSWNSR